MTIKISKDGGAILGGSNTNQVQAALAMQLAQLTVAAVAAFTDNGGGADAGVIYANGPVANVADVSTSSAGKTTAEAAAATVKDALDELLTKANEYATALGITTVTDSIGGTTPDGTIAAVTKTVTAVTTGIQATETNAYIVAVNKALNTIRGLVNKCSRALGYAEVGITLRTGADTPALLTTVPALGVSLGTAADPAVSKAAFDAVLTDQANSIKALSVALDRLTAARAPLVLVG
jgi:hypothetical protein